MKNTALFLNSWPRLPDWSARLSLLALTVVLCGCPAPTNNLPPPAPTSGATNKIVIRGSNTIGEELAPALIAAFQRANPAIKFDVETKATGYGLAALRVGQCDLAAASRPAIMADLDLARDAGLTMNDYVIGSYSVAVVVAAGNPVTNLTKQQVQDIFTGKIQNWKELGGPDLAIKVQIRDPISGTHLGFKDLALGNSEYVAHPNLHTNYAGIATTVAANPGAIGYVGLTSAQSPGVKAVSIEGVVASRATVKNSTYPYTRPLRFYTNSARESAETKKFLDFVLSAAGQRILAEHDFVPNP